MNDELNRSHDKIWYVRKEGKVFGPMAASRVRHHLLEGKLELSDEVSRNRQSWQSIRNQPEVVPVQMRNPDAYAGDGNDATGGKKRFWTTLITLMAILAGLIVTVVMVDNGPDRSIVDCNAMPAAQINWSNCNKHRFNAQGANLTDLIATNAILTSVNFAGSKMANANLGYSRLDDSDFAYADLSGAIIKGASLKNVDFSNARLNDADLRFSDFSGARISGADLSGAKLENAVWIDGRKCARGSIGSCQ